MTNKHEPNGEDAKRTPIDTAIEVLNVDKSSPTMSLQYKIHQATRILKAYRAEQLKGEQND
jgi:hypothetical protein